MKNSLKQALILSLLTFLCLSADNKDGISVTPTTTVTSSQNSPNQNFGSSILIISIDGNQNQNLQAYDVKNLKQSQQEVNKFIRSKIKVGDSNLTDARGDGNTFVYTYQNKTDKSEQVWVITVKANKNSGQNNSGQKFVITGINSVSNIPMSEEQKAKLKQKLQKQQRKMQSKFKKFQKNMNQFGARMQDFGDQMSQLGNMFGEGSFLGLL